GTNARAPQERPASRRGSLVEVVLGPAIDGSVVGEVRDNGRGGESDVASKTPGLGMLGMRERAVILGGRLEVQAAAGGGTSVRAVFPKEELACVLPPRPPT